MPRAASWRAGTGQAGAPRPVSYPHLSAVAPLYRCSCQPQSRGLQQLWKPTLNVFCERLNVDISVAMTMCVCVYVHPRLYNIIIYYSQHKPWARTEQGREEGESRLKAAMVCASGGSHNISDLFTERFI